MKKLKIKIDNFEKALSRLNEALNEMEENQFKPDVCIQRFEFTYEMSWKALQSLLRERGIFATSPKQTIENSYKESLLGDMNIWVSMKNSRNDTSHEYNEEKAKQIYREIPSYTQEFSYVLNNLKSELADA